MIELGRSHIIATGATIFALGVAGCSTVEEPPTKVQADALVKEYDEELGVRLSDRETYFKGTEMGHDDLLEDLSDRKSPLKPGPIVAETEEYAPVSIRHTDFADYESKIRGIDMGYSGLLPDWHLTRRIPGEKRADKYLPILRIMMQPGGTLEITDQRPPEHRDDDTHNEAYDELVEEVVKPASGILYEAFKAKALKSFVIAFDTDTAEQNEKYGSGSSFFTPYNREAALVINKSVTAADSYEDVVETIDHETTHAFITRIFKKNKNFGKYLGTRDLNALMDACQTIKTDTLEEVEGELTTLRPLLDKLERLDRKAFRRSIQYFRANLKTSTILDLNYRSGKYDKQYGILQECVMNPAKDMIDGISYRYGDTDDKSTHTEKSINTYNKLNDKYSSIYRKSSVLKAISEHGYKENELSGHPEDSVDELFASFVGIAMQYPDEFKSNVLNLSISRPNSAEAIRTTYRITRKIIIREYPAMAKALPKDLLQ